MARSAFTLLEDGRPRAIAAFEPRVLERLAAQDATAETLDTGVATNENPLPTGGRTLALLIDDAGIEPLHMTYVARALSAWLRPLGHRTVVQGALGLARPQVHGDEGGPRRRDGSRPPRLLCGDPRRACPSRARTDAYGLTDSEGRATLRVTGAYEL